MLNFKVSSCKKAAYLYGYAAFIFAPFLMLSMDPRFREDDVLELPDYFCIL